MVTCVAFDAGGVLVSGVPVDMLEALSENYEGEEKEKVRTAHAKDDGSAGDAYELWARLKTDPTYPATDYWHDFKQLYPFIKEKEPELSTMLTASTTHFQATLDLAKELQDKGLTIAIVSNHATEWLNQIIQEHKVDEVFTDKKLIIISQEVKCAKPDPKITNILLQRLGDKHKASTVVFVDDKPRNINAVNKQGFIGITFNAKKQPISFLRNKLIELKVLQT
eukprot:TRINITY_DN1365_c0_g1_i1.p1 TRINITY_DN1365_c0_g1~~TRINITY_DN1365_c0_g1_i1.p1  ORF type:complete len:223 (+),score=41.25 TRINITY_DN1365_c0_g1_i1:43-711(+)